MQDFRLFGMLGAILVHSYQRLLTCVYAGLRAGGGFLNPQLRDALLNRQSHAACLFHFADVLPSSLRQVVGQPLHIVAAAPRVGHSAQPRLLLQEQLRVARHPRRKISRQCQSLVKRVGMERLSMPAHRSHRLHASAHDVVVHIGGGETPA